MLRRRSNEILVYDPAGFNFFFLCTLGFLVVFVS